MRLDLGGYHHNIGLCPANQFWQSLSATVANSKNNRYADGYERVHGGQSIGERNAEGEKFQENCGWRTSSTEKKIDTSPPIRAVENERKNDPRRTLRITASGNSSRIDSPNKKETIYSENEPQNKVVA
ncbi:hypothetical protein ACOME3_008690 [Neoechinorhynchus agilis]